MNQAFSKKLESISDETFLKFKAMSPTLQQVYSRLEQKFKLENRAQLSSHLASLLLSRKAEGDKKIANWLQSFSSREEAALQILLNKYDKTAFQKFITNHDNQFQKRLPSMIKQELADHMDEAVINFDVLEQCFNPKSNVTPTDIVKSFFGFIKQESGDGLKQWNQSDPSWDCLMELMFAWEIEDGIICIPARVCPTKPQDWIVPFEHGEIPFFFPLYAKWEDYLGLRYLGVLYDLNSQYTWNADKQKMDKLNQVIIDRLDKICYAVSNHEEIRPAISGMTEIAYLLKLHEDYEWLLLDDEWLPAIPFVRSPSKRMRILPQVPMILGAASSVERGLHYYVPPHLQSKMGEILADLRMYNHNQVSIENILAATTTDALEVEEFLVDQVYYLSGAEERGHFVTCRDEYYMDYNDISIEEFERTWPGPTQSGLQFIHHQGNIQGTLPENTYACYSPIPSRNIWDENTELGQKFLQQFQIKVEMLDA